ncbi:MAG TPA: DegT/DnrJ/EryC1/StrS family aminotransferase [Bacteroidia bacterium]|nr:DegT/DnrJ/EryC1/StrS family aminotransferase [Bacteroidia bacterium]
MPHCQGDPCPVAESYAERVLCLPLYHDLELNDIDRICNIVKATFGYAAQR